MEKNKFEINRFLEFLTKCNIFAALTKPLKAWATAPGSYLDFVWRGHDRVGRCVKVLEDAADQPPGDAAAAVANVNGHVFSAFDGEHLKKDFLNASCLIPLSRAAKSSRPSWRIRWAV